MEEHEYHLGQRLGLPPQGPGSVAGLGLRTLALLLDWTIAYFLSRLVTRDPYSIEQILFFAGEVILFTWLIGGSMGQRFLRLRVVALPGLGRLSLPKVVLRTLLILLVFPAVVYDRDQRGLHDRVASSVVVRG